MKKSAILAAVLVLTASSAYAYENSYAGYSVKDGDPYVRVETNKVYGYSVAQSTDVAKIAKEAEKNSKKKVANTASLDKYRGANSINYYTAEEMKEIIGEDFSTAYFNAEYDKLALLERSELNLKTVPTPLLDLEKYNAFENKGNIVVQAQLLKEKLDKITPTIKLEKVGKHKAINVKYLYKQANTLNNVDVTLMSANDRLYILTNFSQDSTMYATKEEAKGQKDKQEKVSFKDTMQEALNIENVKPGNVASSVMGKFATQHQKLLKSFAFVEPTKTFKKLTFNDSIMGKKITLPDDWYYAQTRYQIGTKTNATITLAGSVPEAQAAANAVDLDGLLNTATANMDNVDFKKAETDPALAKVTDKYLQELRKAVNYTNSGFITTSFKVEEESWKEMLATPVSNQLAMNVLLRDSLKRLKNFSSENFALKDYNYKLDFTREKANIHINADFMALKDYDFNGKLFLGCQNDIASMMFFVKKAGFAPDAALIEQINSWQF